MKIGIRNKQLAGFCISVLLTLLAVSSPAQQKDPLPEQKDVLTQLQKSGGRDWSVTTIPEGYLMTYAHPVVFYPSTSSISQTDLNQQLLHGKTAQLCIKIIIGRVVTEEELHRQNPYSELPEIPMDAKLKQELNHDHYFICSPQTWAAGPNYTVYIVSNEAASDAIFPHEAEESMDQILSDLGALFHF